MMQSNELTSELCRFIQQRSGATETIEPNTDLLSSGLVDSLLVMDVVTHIEQRYGIRLTESDMTPQHFGSVQALTELIKTRLLHNSP